ncbi:MAG: hypothetical protein K9L17_13920 [Clostridiales bacterium]|nr:hypothetical protein [Clostridiales bacterium]MCF8023770.1 hypothetical protein [Clostridiales bacterium]
MTRKRGLPYAVGQILILIIVLFLLYTYYYYAYYYSDPIISGPFSADVWIKSFLLSFTTTAAGVFIELSRFWGWVIEYKFKQELLILQGIPAGLIGMIPSTIWTRYFESGYPFNFLADPSVSAAAGVWFGIILLRSFFDHKKIEEDEKNKEETDYPYK